MKKVELVYFLGCPSVPSAMAQLTKLGIGYAEVVKDGLPVGDLRLAFSSPSLLVDGELILGCKGQGDSCSIDRWDTDEARQVLEGIAIGSQDARANSHRVVTSR